MWQTMLLVAANVFIKQSWTDEKGGPPGLGLDIGLTTPRLKIHFVTKCYTGPQGWLLY